MPHCSLMASLKRIEFDNPYTMCSNINNSVSIVVSWDSVLKWFGESIQLPILNTHPPYEVVNVGDMFLVYFYSEYYKRTPWSFTSFVPSVGEEFLDLLHNYFRFIWAICSLLASYWFQVTGVYTKFNALNCSMGALFEKSVPILLNNLDNIIPSSDLNILADIYIFLQFSGITIIGKLYQEILFGIFPEEIWAKNTIFQRIHNQKYRHQYHNAIGCFVF